MIADQPLCRSEPVGEGMRIVAGRELRAWLAEIQKKVGGSDADALRWWATCRTCSNDRSRRPRP
jgi:hypothetical protein